MGLDIVFADLEWLMVALFVLGSILIAIEVIVPGFGVAGVLGIISLIFGVVIASKVVSTTALVVIVAIVLVAITLLIIWFYRSVFKGGKLSKVLVLKSKADDDTGYIAPKDYSFLLGQRGEAITVLRPTGTAEFDGEKVDVITEGEFIQAGSQVEVIKVEGFKIIVEGRGS